MLTLTDDSGKVLGTYPEPGDTPKATPEQWAALKAPFELDEIELLPRYTGRKNQAGDPVDDNGNARRKESCQECGGYHYFPCVHLAYVGHAGITMRLNEGDPDWNWRPMAVTPQGTPLITDGGLWIWLTVLGKTIPAYGDAGSKKPPFTGSAVKELIGDAIRNGAMRFGVGTYLWSKSEKAKAELTRQGIDDDDEGSTTTAPKTQPQSAPEPHGQGQGAAGGPSDAQQRLIHALAKERGLSHQQLRELAGVASMKELTPGKTGTATVFIEKLKAIPKLSKEEQEAYADALLQEHSDAPYQAGSGE